MVITIILFMSLVFLAPAVVRSHGLCADPLPRGALRFNTSFISTAFDPKAPFDSKVHFPSGDKSERAGAGLDSQIRSGGPNWVPYNPNDPDFKLRAGFCGDTMSNREHERGGKFYHGGKIVASYEQGGKLSLMMAVNAHHNGYIEVRVCDVSQCGGEINRSCFLKGHCHLLRRAKSQVCDSGKSVRCGPIDRRFPSRWYLPCSKYPGRDFKVEFYGRNEQTIVYSLPPTLQCEHCVMQFYWTSANTCNPPGLVRYFDGPDKPHWGKCKGQGGAIGGVARNQRACGRKRFPEEYYTCHDIRINVPRNEEQENRPGVVASTSASASSAKKRNQPRNGPKQGQRVSQTPKPSSIPAPTRYNDGNKKKGCMPLYNANIAMRTGFGAVRDLVLIGDGCRIGSLANLMDKRGQVRVSQFSKFAIEVIVIDSVKLVSFFIDSKIVATGKLKPFIVTERRMRWALNGNGGRRKYVTLTAKAGRDEDSLILKFV